MTSSIRWSGARTGFLAGGRLLRPVFAALAACKDQGTAPDLPGTGRVTSDPPVFYALGDTLTFATEGFSGPLTWTSTGEDVVTVSGTGLVTAVGNGSATVGVQGGDGSDEVAVTVDTSTWVELTVGENFVCGLVADASAFCWGDNNWARDGERGPGGRRPRDGGGRPAVHDSLRGGGSRLRCDGGG